MAEHKIVEVRFDCGLHDLTEGQVFGLLRAFPDYDISVGLGYGGAAAVVVLDATDTGAESLAGQINTLARQLGLTPTLVEVLDVAEYEARALAELGEQS